MAAAHESSEHAASAESTNVGPTTLEQLQDDVIRLARASVYADLVQLFPELVRVRDRIYRLLEGHQYPGQTNELYLLASVTCCLLADASHNFGYRTAALEQTRAAWAYAEIIGHDSLRVWCRSMQSWLAYLDDRPSQAITLAQSGQQYARNATGQIRLYGMEGNALAAVGDRDRAQSVFDQARTAREQMGDERDEIFDDIGGIFVAPLEKQFLNAASGYVQLGMPDEAVREAQSAVELYMSRPTEERDVNLESLARIELAAARLMLGELDAARNDLGPVLSQPVNHRVDPIDSALRPFQKMLALPPFAGSSEARSLRGEVEDFRSMMLPHGVAVSLGPRD